MMRRILRWMHASQLPGVTSLCLGLAACGLMPHYQRPELDLPESTQPAMDVHAQRATMLQWWHQFRDPVLDRLIHDALDKNLSIALQAAKVSEARAQLGLARAQYYPTLGAQFDASRTRASSSLYPQAANDRYSNAYSVAAALNYELNLFAALASHKAAAARLLASVHARDAVQLAVVGDVVAAYMSLRDLQNQVGITQSTIETRSAEVSLAEKRYEQGAIGRLELLQKRALLAGIMDQLPQLRQQRDQLESALALLTGRSPREIVDGGAIRPGTLDGVVLPADLPALLPSELVNRRPDIRAAEAVLVAANADVSVARAQYFPTLNLSALIGSAAGRFGDLFEAESDTASIGGALGAPILSFGRIRAGVETSKAQREQAALIYRQTVRQAFKEVRDALRDIDATRERVAAGQREVQAYGETLKLAQDRYQAGLIGLQDVLDAQRQLYSARLGLSGATRDRFVATANLFKALGGGWTEAQDSQPQDSADSRRE